MFYFDGTQSHQFLSKQTIDNFKERLEQATAIQFFKRIKQEFYNNQAELLRLKRQFALLPKEEQLNFLEKIKKT